MVVNFHENVEDELLKFAVIIAKHNNKWVFCRHKERNTFEVHGGHREEAEPILYTALIIADTEENVDYDVLITACLLHDIGRKEQLLKCQHFKLAFSYERVNLKLWAIPLCGIAFLCYK